MEEIGNQCEFCTLDFPKSVKTYSTNKVEITRCQHNNVNIIFALNKLDREIVH